MVLSGETFTCVQEVHAAIGSSEVDLPLEAIEMAETEQKALNNGIEFVYYKVNTFTENYVDEAILPAVEGRLDAILQLLDKLIMKWLNFKSDFKDDPCIPDLEKHMTDLTECVAGNEKKVRMKVIQLLKGEHSEQKVGMVQEMKSKDFPIRNQSAQCDAKKSEFFDLISLLSVSCGLDLANPETELDSDVLEEDCKAMSNGEISDKMRESKFWSKSLADLSRVFRDYEKAAKESNEEAEELESNQTVFETAKTRLLAFKVIIFKEDKRRNLFTLDNTKAEKVKFPTFSGDKKEDFFKFKIKMEQAFLKNRVVLCDQFDKLKENLRAEALKHVPETVTDLDVAWSYLKEGFGDPLRILKERIKALDSIKALPPVKKKEIRVTWFLDFESILEDVIQLGGDNPGSKSYCTAFSEFTLEKILFALPDEGEDVFLRKELSSADGEGKEQFENIKKKVAKFRQDSQAFIGSSVSTKKRDDSAIKAHPSSCTVGDVSRLEDCRVCSLVDSDAAFASTVGVELFEQHFGNYPTHCPMYISFSLAKRRAVAIKVGLCTHVWILS